jgi:uncharacterized protein with NRDE domain
MCLLVVGWRAHERLPLVVAANRDEFHARGAAPLAPWEEVPGMLAGRDLLAGGTWLGIDGRGRFGLVTNFRERLRPRRGAPSRGGLVPAFLRGQRSPCEFLAALESDAPGYSGFNLLVSDGDELWYACNRAEEFARPLAPGVYGVANQFLDAPWPKLLRVRSRISTWLAADRLAGLDAPDAALIASNELLGVLNDRQPGAVPPGLATGLPAEWERALSAPFVVHPEYGTRCSTVVLAMGGGQTWVAERSFDRAGLQVGEARFLLDRRNPGEPRAL